MNAEQFPTPTLRGQNRNQALFRLISCTFMFMLVFGCTHSPLEKLRTHLTTVPDTETVFRTAFFPNDAGRIPLVMAIVLDQDSHNSPLPLTEDNWLQFASKIKKPLQDQLPVAVDRAIQVEKIPSRDDLGLVHNGHTNSHLEGILLVIPSSVEVHSPARLDIMPEVGALNGSLIENHTLVEIGILNPALDKLVLAGKGSSFATLEQLDVPLASNRYPRVRGSAMTSPIFPGEETALETLRHVALHEALAKAILDFSENWPKQPLGNPLQPVRQAPTPS